ncbi:hypothetical protein PWT90_10684 [Aphanocladium album]|nr:hypothetical protein PWT90_10684 [Aphanocladium album]
MTLHTFGFFKVCYKATVPPPLPLPANKEPQSPVDKTLAPMGWQTRAAEHAAACAAAGPPREESRHENLLQAHWRYLLLPLFCASDAKQHGEGETLTLGNDVVLPPKTTDATATETVTKSQTLLLLEQTQLLCNKLLTAAASCELDEPELQDWATQAYDSFETLKSLYELSLVSKPWRERLSLKQSSLRCVASMEGLQLETRNKAARCVDDAEEKTWLAVETRRKEEEEEEEEEKIRTQR